jgi:hypothetical protein
MGCLFSQKPEVSILPLLPAVELEYRRNELTDSVVYTYMDNLLISEYHYDLEGGTGWSIIYEYNSNNNLIKETSNPDGTYTINSYEGRIRRYCRLPMG